VRLIEDDDAVLALVGGPGLNLGREQASIVDAAVGGRVNLFDIEAVRLLEDRGLLAAGRGDLAAVHTLAAGLLRRPLRCSDWSGAVERSGENA
jgi:hypothetical protein